MAETKPSKRKKSKPPSWQRRKKKKLSSAPVPSAPATSIATLQLDLAEAKAASQGARDRFRLHQPPLDGDEELAARYSAAKKALHDFMRVRDAAKPKPTAAAHEQTQAEPAAPREKKVRFSSEAKKVISHEGSSDESKRGKRKVSAGGPDCVSVYTAEALGVSPEERRLAKKAAKKAAKRASYET
ncbi:hypothetical protein AB1Y20_005089 [Prymnesium parvum]|uniref:Ribosome biogenesis protein NOP53 n=1 Tax=Prymnesium parvum TaxID=97485 RepID=A0AB34J2S9_PRYPA